MKMHGMRQRQLLQKGRTLLTPARRVPHPNGMMARQVQLLRALALIGTSHIASISCASGSVLTGFTASARRHVLLSPSRGSMSTGGPTVGYRALRPLQLLLRERRHRSAHKAARMSSESELVGCQWQTRGGTAGLCVQRRCCLRCRCWHQRSMFRSVAYTLIGHGHIDQHPKHSCRGLRCRACGLAFGPSERVSTWRRQDLAQVHTSK